MIRVLRSLDGRGEPTRRSAGMPVRRPLSEASRRIAFSVTAAVAIGMAAHPALAGTAAEAGIERGRLLLETNCARCHAVEATGESPYPPAPPFRTLHERYPVEDLEEALAEGIVTGHPDMPEFAFDPDQVSDIVLYLRSLQRD